MGAIVIVVVVGGSGSGFYWTPLSLGLVYLAGAISGGPRGSYWATAVVLVGWGTAVVVVRQFSPDLNTSGLYLVGAGLGATVGMLLARRGFAVDPLGAAITVLIGGVLLTLEARYSGVLADARFYAALLGIVGLVNLLLAAFAGEDLAHAEHGSVAP